MSIEVRKTNYGIRRMRSRKRKAPCECAYCLERYHPSGGVWIVAEHLTAGEALQLVRDLESRNR